MGTLYLEWKHQSLNMRLVGKVRPLTFVSNLGMINLERSEVAPFQPPWGHIDISQLTFTQSAMVSSAPLTLSVVSISDGLTISTSWQPEALDEAVAQGFCHGLSDWLKYLGHGK
ncbi:hypothetical protein N7455_007680 [Penicillium solitum]|uniref:uncharacterized protein n=1 Tax=Penicillium solitum TaxID=60172 RepID=UPI0032C4569D|nr:hypothetical protein N7455_007680 [Penicillium solitum]